MPSITLPSGNIITPAAPYSRETLISLLKEISSRPAPFTGYLAISCDGRLFILFIFQGQTYAAGIAQTEKSIPLTISNFCAQVASLREGKGTISLHETDPVLLKCLLVLIQDEPAAKGPVNLINLEGMVHQIRENASDALVILESEGRFNLFFFLEGTKTAAYWAENAAEADRSLSVDEQMLLYAFSERKAGVNATIYQSLSTIESRDSANMSLDGIARLFDGVEETEKTIAPGKLTANMSDKLVLKVLEGMQAGMTLCGSIPCILGRKDSDILINDQMVSKRHAAIQIINGKLMLVDLHSTNGTNLNNEPVSQRELKTGDRIGIGQTLLLVESINLQ